MVQKLKINVKERFSDGEIDLSMSDLDEVPVKEIAALKKTTSLDLSNNRLTSLPHTFTTLVNLTKLDLSKNELTELPEDFGNLSKLKYLDLYKNNLERLPLSFGKLSGLKFLDLKDNSLIPTIAKVAGPCVDTKGCQQCARDVVNFYRRLQEEVDNEVEMRKKARQKQLEINQQKKQEEKKKIKKEKQNSKPKKDSEKVNLKKSANVTKRQNKKEQKVKEEGSSFFYYTMCALIFAISMFLYFYNFQYDLLQPFILSSKQFYLNFLDTLPVSCRYYIESFGDTMYYVQKSTRNVTLSYIKALRNNEIIQGIMLKMKEGISSLQERIGKNE